MKILHVVPTYLPAVRYGGPIFAVHALAKALVCAGHQVSVFTTNVDGSGVSAVPLHEPVVMDGVEVRYFPVPLLRRLYYSPSMGAHVRRHAADFDTIHLHSVFLYPTAAAARAAHKQSVPYVLSPRGMLVDDLIQERHSVVKRAWIAAVESTNLARAAVVHATSNYERDAISGLGLRTAPIAVIPNGVEAPPLTSTSPNSADVEAACRGGVDVLAFGRINWKKGLDLLIRAIAEIPGIRAAIAGNDEESYANVLRSLAQECGVGDRVSFLVRAISGADKEALFRAARVVAMPSLSENFGNVVAEAMARGRAVAVTEGVGAAEMVKASGCGVVVRRDLKALADGLRYLLAKSDRELGEMGRAGSRYVNHDLSWQLVAHSFERLYRQITAESAVIRDARLVEPA